MGSRRRGSKGAISAPTWTELFHKMATGVLKHAVHENLSSETVIREIPAIGKSVVNYIQKKGYETTANAVSHKSKNDNINNVSSCKKEDSINSVIKTNSNLHEYKFESRKIEENAENNAEPENLEESFVYIDNKDDDWQNVSLKGLPSNVTEDKEMKIIDIGYNVADQRSNPEQKILQCTNCRKLGDDKTTCSKLLTSETRREPSNINFFENNSITDVGYNSIDSNNSYTLNESISKDDILLSSTNIIANSPSPEKEHNASDSKPKETYVQNKIKLVEELKEIKKEVEQKQLEPNINVAKKSNCNFLRVILQGIPAEVKSDNIVNDLKSKQFSVQNVYRLKDEENKVTNRVIIELPKEENHIFHFSCCLGFQVNVEEYKGDISNVKNSHVSHNISGKCNFPKKLINVAVTGIPVEISESDILKDLNDKDFHPNMVEHSMIPAKPYLLGQTKHVVLVQVPSEEVHIYALSCILGFSVSVESVDKETLNVKQGQTYLQFGHSYAKCSEEKSVKVEKFKECKISDVVPTLNAVVKGVPLELADNMVLNDFIKNGFNPIAIYRMIIKDEVLPAYLVQVPEQEQRILLLTCCLGFSVKVEKFVPNSYYRKQCTKCPQFGNHNHNNECIEIRNMNLLVNEIKSEDFQETGNSKMSTGENLNGIANREKIDKKDNQEELIAASTFLNVLSSSTEMQCWGLEQRLTNKLNNLEFTLDKFIKENNEKLNKLCSCKNVTEISRNDASTNTDDTYAQIQEITEAVKSHVNISAQFVKNIGLFVTSFSKMNNSENVKEIFKAHLELGKISGPLVQATIQILKSATNLMLDIPNLPGVTVNSINEQLYLLEKLENIKKTIDDTPSRFTSKYDIHFPKLE